MRNKQISLLGYRMDAMQSDILPKSKRMLDFKNKPKEKNAYIILLVDMALLISFQDHLQM